MVEPKSSQFWKMAVQYGLILPAKLEACWEAIPPEKRVVDAIDRRLARQAVNAGLVTAWQAQQVLAGRCNALRVDRYLILDQIGQGGMGRVYLARDTRLGRLVALKVLSRERMANPRALIRFRREAKLGAQLQHENLIRVYDEGNIGEMPYLVMEYITGKTVAQMMAEQGRILPAEAAELARQVALGLEHLHQKDLLHRDVNPTNIMVDQEGTAKLTDLGLAIDLGDEEEIVTRDGATVGTFDYISPEQARNPREIDTRSDIYSLGCTLYHMLAGHVPFQAPSLPEKLFAHQSSQPESLCSQFPEIPEGLQAIVATMMNKRPEDRFPRPIAVARALQPYAHRFQHTESSETRLQSGAHVPHTGSRTDLVSPTSDSDLDNTGSEVLSSKPLLASRGLDLNLDFGPAPPLLDRPTMSRSRSGSHDDAGKVPHWWKPVVVVSVLLLLAGSLLAIFWPRSSGTASGTGGNTTNHRSKVVSQPADPRRPFQVRFLPGNQEDSAESIEAALKLTSGKTAEILIHDVPSAPIEVEEPIIVTSKITIKAAPGNWPRLDVRLRRPVSFLEGSPGSELRLEKLSIQISSNSEDSSTGTGVIKSLGSMMLDQCSIVGQDLNSRIRGIDAEGGKLGLNRCSIIGFSTAVQWSPSAKSELSLSSSLLVGSGKNPWPLCFNITYANNLTQKVRVSHCTFAGSGFARIQGSAAPDFLDVIIKSSVVYGRWLLDWKAEAPFPGGLDWNGEENLYDLGGDGWIAGTAESLVDVPMGGNGHAISSWVSKDNMQIKENKSQARSLDFKEIPPGNGSVPGNYQLKSADGYLQPWPGISSSELPGSLADSLEKTSP